jgi:hypothetical protein
MRDGTFVGPIRTISRRAESEERVMFDRNVDYPMAVASDDDEGLEAAIDWCCEYMEDGYTLTVWTHLKCPCRVSEWLLNRGNTTCSGVRGGTRAQN